MLACAGMTDGYTEAGMTPSRSPLVIPGLTRNPAGGARAGFLPRIKYGVFFRRNDVLPLGWRSCVGMRGGYTESQWLRPLERV